MSGSTSPNQISTIPPNAILRVGVETVNVGSIGSTEIPLKEPQQHSEEASSSLLGTNDDDENIPMSSNHIFESLDPISPLLMDTHNNVVSDEILSSTQSEDKPQDSNELETTRKEEELSSGTTSSDRDSNSTGAGKNGSDSEELNHIIVTPSLLDVVDDETEGSSETVGNLSKTPHFSNDSQDTLEEKSEQNVEKDFSSSRKESTSVSVPENEDENADNIESDQKVPRVPPPTATPKKKISKISTLLGCGTADTFKELIKATPKRIKDTSKNNENNKYVLSPFKKVKDAACEEIDEDFEDDGTLDEALEFSDLSDPLRNVWIVTTAALPWMTGTAINPFLRALYLVRRRLESGVYDDDYNGFKDVNDVPPVGKKESNYTPEGNNKNLKWYDLKTKKNTGKVTLVIPWLEDRVQAEKLFGKGTITETGEAGKQQQIQWIRKYAAEKCGMAREMEHLHILFYSAAYWKAFGSIFPTEDICSLIPSDEADVAILEEPEHLNWLRMPNEQRAITKSSEEDISNIYSGPPSICGKIKNVSSAVRSNHGTNFDENMDSKDGTEDRNYKEESVDFITKTEEESHLELLGWAHKFNFVVGIIHTNYSAYMKQYGLGSSIIGAPALGAISSMVVRAYCHKVIRLSTVIPNYAKWKEVTSNVHGVRGDFLQGDKMNIGEEEVQEEDSNKCESASIYFIGKLLWAKGFDRMLKVQELYRETNPNREYFPIDVYGGGPDETAILRAFHGRLQNVTSKENLSDQKAEDDVVTSATSFSSDAVFSNPHSIKKQLQNLVDKKENDATKEYSDAMNFINMGFEVVAPETDDNATQNHDVVVMERKVLVSDKEDNVSDPFSILSDVSGNFAAAGITTAEAMMSIADTAVKTGIAATFSQEDQDVEIKTQPSFIFDPPKTLFELRRNPIPARFLGVKDHALLRHSPQHKVFFNPSITEVLCTTTAEALSMGKFAIIPDHPSNQFFLQFPNCLAYKNLRECAQKIAWALENDPAPLSEDHARIFTWEAATDRLIRSSIITKREAQERDRYGREKADTRMAWLHSDIGNKGHGVIKTFLGKIDRDTTENRDQ